jgi:UDP-N-acetylglucosamine 2-epimerase (non-hydrolysing)
MVVKVLVVFGTRPEAIKLAPLIKVLKESGSFSVKVCVTAQHRQMLDQVLHTFEVKPDFDLDLMQDRQTLCDVTSRVFRDLPPVLDAFRPDVVVVQGDTVTTSTAALCAYYNRIPVAHVEAGLRTDDLYSPWPEEGNRRVTSAIAQFHFPPTRAAACNLFREGVPEDRVWVTGNTVIDALMDASSLLDRPDKSAELSQQFSFLNPGKRTILVTGHRRENFGPKFESVCHALLEIASARDVELVYPVHLNPSVQEPVSRLLSGVPNIFLIDPLDYLPFVYLMRRANLIITDSGGVQEEAATFDTPVLVTRDKTERVEAIEAGSAMLVGTSCESIVSATLRLLDSREHYESMARVENPFGDGTASRQIADTFLQELAGAGCLSPP